MNYQLKWPCTKEEENFYVWRNTSDCSHHTGHLRFRKICYWNAIASTRKPDLT